jgi:hypothetical protein
MHKEIVTNINNNHAPKVTNLIFPQQYDTQKVNPRTMQSASFEPSGIKIGGWSGLGLRKKKI